MVRYRATRDGNASTLSETGVAREAEEVNGLRRWRYGVVGARMGVAIRGLALALTAVLALPTFMASARAGTISTIAGDPLLAGPARSVAQDPNSVAVASNGAVYVADARQGVVRRLDATSDEESVIAGDGTLPANGAHAFSIGNPTFATETALEPQALTFDARGDLVVGDGNSARPGGIGLLASSACSSSCPFGLPTMTQGQIYAIAGGGLSGAFPGNGEPGNSVAVEPLGLTTDASGDILIAQGQCVQTEGGCSSVVSLLAATNCSSSCPFDLPTMTEGSIYTIAGGGAEPLEAGRAATSVLLHTPLGVAVDSFGDLVIPTEKVGEISGVGSVQIVAGSNCASACPYGLTAMTKGDIYTIAGGGSTHGNNGEPATNVQLHPAAVNVDSDGDVLIADSLNDRAWVVARTDCEGNCPFGLSAMVTGSIYTIAGGGTSLGDEGPATTAKVDPVAFATDSSGDLLLADDSGDRLRLLASGACSSTCPFGLPALSKSDIYTIAGNGQLYSGDGGPASSAQLSSPAAIVAEPDPEGSIFFDDAGDGRVALIAGSPGCASAPCGFGLTSLTPGDIYTIAGGGTAPATTGSKATSAQISSPEGLARDGNGDLLVSTVTQVILIARSACSAGCPFGLASMTEGDIYIVAGTFSDVATGEEGPATEAGLGNPAGAIAVDPSGDLLIGSPQAQSVRLVAASDCSSNCPFGLAKTIKGDIYKIAGGGSGESGAPATAIPLTDPSSITFDSAGDALVAEPNRGVVWLIAAANCTSNCPLGLASTERGHAYIVAGSTAGGSVESGVPATSIPLVQPATLAIDAAGNLLIFQAVDPTVRVVATADCSQECPYGLSSLTRGDIYAVAGDEVNGYGGDGGPALDANLAPVEFRAAGLAVTQSGDILISDTGNNRVRSVAAEVGKAGGGGNPGGGNPGGGGSNPGGGENPGGTGTTNENSSQGSEHGTTPPPPPTATVAVTPPAAPPPTLAASQTVSPVSGAVTIRLAGTSNFVALTNIRTIPNGSEVDATHGHVVITVATSSPGKTESAEVYGGRFRVEQNRTSAGETHLILSQPLTGCPRVALPRGAAATAQHRSGAKSRHLWVSENGGHWGTGGRYVSTTVEGTRWLTLDECRRSEVEVALGRVKVRDLVRKTTTLVTAGHKYIARLR